MKSLFQFGIFLFGKKENNSFKVDRYSTRKKKKEWKSRLLQEENKNIILFFWKKFNSEICRIWQKLVSTSYLWAIWQATKKKKRCPGDDLCYFCIPYEGKHASQFARLNKSQINLKLPLFLHSNIWLTFKEQNC